MPWKYRKMLLFLLYRILQVHSCLTSYLITSGTRTLYDPGTGSLIPCLILSPPTAYVSYWWTDPDANWVWFTTQWTTGTFKFIEKFSIAKWTIGRLVSAKLKIAANDYLKLIFNGEQLKDYNPWRDDTAFLEYNLMGKLKGTDAWKYEENVMEMYVATEVPAIIEGILYRIELTFS
jgi:hypothetical protein